MGTIQIVDGKIRVVAPEEIALIKLNYPMPGWKQRNESVSSSSN